MLLHKGRLSVVHLPDVLILLLQALIPTDPVGEPETTVIVDRVHGIRKHICETRKVHAESVSLQEQDVIRVNGPHSRYYSIIKREQPCPLLISRLVQQIVSRDPGIALVPIGNNLPQVDDPILEVFVVPECRVASRVITMPVLVLAAGR